MLRANICWRGDGEREATRAPRLGRMLQCCGIEWDAALVMAFVANILPRRRANRVSRPPRPGASMNQACARNVSTVCMLKRQLHHFAERDTVRFFSRVVFRRGRVAAGRSMWMLAGLRAFDGGCIATTSAEKLHRGVWFLPEALSLSDSLECRGNSCLGRQVLGT